MGMPSAGTVPSQTKRNGLGKPSDRGSQLDFLVPTSSMFLILSSLEVVAIVGVGVVAVVGMGVGVVAVVCVVAVVPTTPSLPWPSARGRNDDVADNCK